MLSSSPSILEQTSVFRLIIHFIMEKALAENQINLLIKYISKKEFQFLGGIYSYRVLKR